jgi:ABC-2 type transport system permease protein
VKLFTLATKDLTRASRSLFLVGMSLAAPLLICALIYVSFGGLARGDGAMEPVRVGVVNLDGLPDRAGGLETSLGGMISDLFHEQGAAGWATATGYPDAAAARAAIGAREIDVAVIVPAGYTAAWVAGTESPPITVLQDPTLTIGPTVVRDTVNALLDGMRGGRVAYATLSARVPAAALPDLMARYGSWHAAFGTALLGGQESSALRVVAPAGGDARDPANVRTIVALVMAGQMVFFGFYTGAFSMMSILQEDEEGTQARLFTTPTPRSLILAGKFLAVLAITAVQGTVLVLAGRLMFDADWGAPGAVALALLGQVFAAVGLGVLLISLVKTSRQAGPVLGGGLTALAMLSGLFTTNVPMPAGFTALATLTPPGRALALWRLAVAGEPAATLLVPALILMLYGAVLFAGGAAIFRRRFA